MWVLRYDEQRRCSKGLVYGFLLMDSNRKWYCWHCSCPKQSMYGIFTYIYHKFKPNVGKYTIHGSYGFGVLLIVLIHLPESFDLPTPHWKTQLLEPGHLAGGKNGLRKFWSLFLWIMIKSYPNTNYLFIHIDLHHIYIYIIYIYYIYTKLDWSLVNCDQVCPKPPALRRGHYDLKEPKARKEIPTVGKSHLGPQHGWWKSWKTLLNMGWFGGIYPYFRKHPYKHGSGTQKRGSKHFFC